MVGMEGLRDSGRNFPGRKGSAAPQGIWEGNVVSPTSLGVCAAPEAWLGVSGCPGADHNLGSPGGPPSFQGDGIFVAVTPVKHK